MCAGYMGRILELLQWRQRLGRFRRILRPDDAQRVQIVIHAEIASSGQYVRLSSADADYDADLAVYTHSHSAPATIPLWCARSVFLLHSLSLRCLRLH